MKRYLLLLFAFCMLLLLPNLGSHLRIGGLPDGYGIFPAQLVKGVPPFHATYFWICAAIGLVLVVFLLFPRLFGFKKPQKEPTAAKAPIQGYPKWFYPSIIVTLVSWFLMWARLEILEPLDHFTFVPLWWGFIMVLDGIVYKRNNGRSLASIRPNTLKLLGVVSCFSWFIFEYQNFFVLGNWYYPNNKILTNFGNISWQLLSYTTVLPAIFNWYFLLRTFPSLNTRYSGGPVIKIGTVGQYLFFALALVLTVLMAYYPYELFWMLWVSLVPLFVPVMIIGKYWNPFTEIGRRGDYSYVVLIAIATLINGFFWEFWNFGSEWIHDIAPTNPNYWKYSVPYLDKYHLFSEMPILGYFGYLLFGICCWVLWLLVAYLFDFDYRISLNGEEDA
jgi:hypothetical protein